MRAAYRSSDVSIVFCLSVVSGRSIRISTVRGTSHGLPVHVASIHLTFSMCDAVAVPSYVQLNRVSLMYTIWPPAWTGFHELYHVILIGPPAASGFPFTPQKDSGIRPIPCICRSIQWASCIVRLPDCILFGLRRGPASMSCTM